MSGVPIDELFTAVRQFTHGTVQRDDVPALVLKYTGA